MWSIPIHFDAPVRHTFCYVVRNEHGDAVIIDPGWDSPVGRSALEAGLLRAGISWPDVIGVVSTHSHPDHLGMVAFVRERSGAWIALGEKDAVLLPLYDDVEAVLRGDREWYERLGAPRERIEGLVITREQVRETAGMARPDRLLADGDILPLRGRTLQVVATPGHTPGHVCVVDRDNGLIFTGDHVLPRITPNIGMTALGTRTSALADYLSSLERMRPWDAFEVCPAHEYRFSGLAERAAHLRAHHEERSEEIVRFVRRGTRTVWQTAEALSWARPWETFDGINVRAALGETAAHLDHLVDKGVLMLTTSHGADNFS